MPTPSKKHHYVPKAQLAHFSIDGRGKQVWVFDKQEDRVWPSSLMDAGSENAFNTIELDQGGSWNFEDIFGDVDDLSATLIRRIVGERSMAWLDADGHAALLELFATQMLRTHLTRSTPLELTLQLRKVVADVGLDPDDDPSLAIPDERSRRLGTVRAFIGRAEAVSSMARLFPTLFAAPEHTRFLLSDHPVALSNAYSHGEPALDSHGVIVLLPVAPTLAVALICPTIVRRYKVIDGVEMPPDQRARMEHYRTGFHSRQPIEIEPGEVHYWNRLQVARSRRYLYGAVDDFDFAREMLDTNDGLRNVRSHISLGALGEAPPGKQGMPSGRHLVVRGRHDTCMLTIVAIDEDGESLTAQTTDIDLLDQVANDANELSVELYQDGRSQRGLNCVCLERVEREGGGWFRVVHRDASLRDLMRQIDAGRKR